MGKKSVMDTPLLPSAEGQGVDALEVTLPAEQSALGELFQEFLRVALQAQVDTQESRSKNQVSAINVQTFFLVCLFLGVFLTHKNDGKEMILSLNLMLWTLCFRRRTC